MEKKQVWELMKKEDIPQDRRTIKCKWIFKIKRNGFFRARLVACGYSQIPGVDFNKSFAPVVNDVSFRIILTAKFLWDLQASIVDVETTFLHGNLQEGIYMNVPKGMSQDDNTCLFLKKTIYGLVQSTREFYNKLLSAFKSMGFTENKSDPCLLSKWINGKVIIIGIYDDDCHVVGKEDKIQEAIQCLKASGFNLKVESSLKDYLRCHAIENLESKSILILRPHLINNLEAKFRQKVCNKEFTKLLELQDSRLFARLQKMMLLTQIFKEDINPLLECCCT
jgi:hypothetical protein